MGQTSASLGVNLPAGQARPDNPPVRSPDSASVGELKRLLESGTVIKQRLERVPSGQATCGGKHPLCGQVDHLLANLAAAIRRSETQQDEAARVELRQALYNRAYGDDTKLDGFRYAILARDGQFAGACQRQEPFASNAFLRDPSTYELVPREWLPTAFRERLEPLLEDQAYHRGDHATAASDWSAFERYVARVRQDPARAGLATGFSKLDAALGGLRGICFLAGGPGVGKSCLSLAMALGVLRNHPDAGVLLVLSDLGMSRTTVYTRLLATASGVPFRDLQSRERRDQSEQKLQDAGLALRRNVLSRLRVTEAGERPRQVHELRAYLASQRACLLQTGVPKRVLTIVDHFHALRLTSPAPEGTPAVDENRARMSVLQELQSNTRTPGCPVGEPLLVLGEVRKGDSGRGRLTQWDILGSAEIAYAAEAILLLEEGKNAASGQGSELLLQVAKVRDGGLRADVALHFDPACARIVEASAAPRALQRVNPSRGKSPAPRAIDPLAGETEE